MNRFIIAAGLALLLFVIGLIILLGGGSKPTPTTKQLKPLQNYSATNAQVSMTTDGEINGQDIHRQIVITVDQYARTLQITKGYNGQVISTKTFDNNETAYNVFLTSIKNAGFLVANKKANGLSDKGQCPLGFRNIFELNDGGDQLSRLWSSTCGKNGTLGGNSSLLQSLFKAQITNYDELVADVNLSDR
jgi:hypothetical protein